MPLPTLKLKAGRAYFTSRLLWPPQSLSIYLSMTLPLLLALIVIGLNISFHGEPVRVWFESLRTLYPLTTEVMDFISDYADNVLYLIYIGLILYSIFWNHERLRHFCLRFLLGVFCVLIAVDLAKMIFGMPRPGVSLARLAFSFRDGFESFPSGHTAQIVALALPLAFYFRKKATLLVLALLVTIVGLSRLWLGRHHPVDVAGGLFFGSLVLLLIYGPRRLLQYWDLPD